LLRAQPIGAWPGAPLRPEGDPMLAGVGPGSWAERADVPDMTLEGRTRLVPLRLAPGFAVVGRDLDPRGMTVYGADRAAGGIVRDLWVDRAEMLFRYIELEVQGGARRVLLPMNFARISRRGVRVRSILGAQFAQVPATRSADQVTLLEEEKIMAYYGAGTLYATPMRQEPML
jgi:photosynthetic reaction center H subunit